MSAKQRRSRRNRTRTPNRRSRERQRRRRSMDRMLVRDLDRNSAAAKWDLFGVAKPKPL